MEKNTEILARTFGSYSFFSRSFLYLVALVILEFIIAVVVSSGFPSGWSWIPKYNIIFKLWLLAGLVPFILFEFFVIRARRKYGLGIFRSYLKSGWMPFGDFDENMARLGALSPLYEDWVKKNPNYGVSGNSSQGVSADRNDLSYWYDLLQKGAITEEEYVAKKVELL